MKGKVNDWELCLTEFEKAYNEATILKNLLPDNDEAKYRFLMLLISIIAVLVGVIAVTSYFI